MKKTKLSGLEVLLDLGLQPISNRFLPPSSNEIVPHYPMKFMLDKETGLVRLESPFPVEDVKPRYDWLTCFEPEDHLDDMIEKILNLPNINKNSVFAGYSFKDDSTLARLSAKGYQKLWRIKPQSDLGVSDLCANIETYQDVFTVTKAKQIQKRREYADVMIVRHVVEHAYDLPEFVSAINTLIHKEGYIVWELPDCESALSKGDCTTIWEEHIHYFTSHTFKQMLKNSGLTIIYYESVPYPQEDSLVVITKKNKKGKSSVLLDENAVNVENDRAYQFAKKVTERKKVIQAKLRKFKKSSGSIAIFGAGHLSVAFIAMMEIADMIDFVVDDNPHKRGMIMPIGGIEILGSDSLYSREVSLCLLGLNPLNQPKVITKHTSFTKKGGIFASIFPGTDLAIETLI
jgi:hypothetical protein